jgi:hypothetical protein
VFFCCIAALQSSTFNDFTADLAVDSSPLTCSQTGSGNDNWLKIDLGSVIDIQSLSINGRYIIMKATELSKL